MKKNRNLVCLLMLAMMFAISACSGPRTAAVETLNTTNPAIQVTADAFGADGQAKVTVSLKNNPGIAGFAFQLDYDNTKVTPVSYTKGEAFQAAVSNLDQGGDFANFTFVKTSWIDSSNVNDNGELISVIFQAKPGLADETADFTVEYQPGGFMNQDLEEIQLEIINAKEIKLPKS